MQSSSKPEQKSYRKGSSLYFTAGLVVSMVLIVSAFEWNTTYLLSDKGPIELDDKNEGEIIDFIPISMPAPPRAKPTTVNPVPAPVLPVDPVDVPPIDINKPDDPNHLLPPPGVLTGSAAPVDFIPGMPDISQAAEPAEGYKAFYAYIYERVKVPNHLISRNQDGTVRVSFVVDRDGKITELQILKGFDKQLEEQILKILQEAPAWKPAWQHGSPIKQRMVLPITIKIAH